MISDLQVFNKPWGTFDPVNNLDNYKSVHFGPVPNSSSYEIYTKTTGTPTLDRPTRAAITHYTLHISEANYAVVTFGSGKEYTLVAGGLIWLSVLRPACNAHFPL